MRVWIDILTPKQVLFFEALISELAKKKNMELILTSRNYRELNEMLRLHEINTEVIGAHGGGDLKQKLISSAKRIIDLTEYIEETKPDVAVSFSSVEAARVAFGLSIPHVCISDSPHSVAVSKLTVPLSKLLCTPYVIPKNIWTKYGIDKTNIIQYKAIDAYVWLKNFKPNSKVIEQLNIKDKEKAIITLRTEESFAAYLLKRTTIRNYALIELIKKLASKFSDARVIVVPRYKEQSNFIKSEIDESNVIILDKVIETQSLLYYSDVFIGGGGTMNAEAALLGVPVVSIYPGKTTIVEKFLIKKKLVYRSLKIDDVIRYVQKVLSDKKYKKVQKQRAQILMKEFIDPVKEIIKCIECFKY